MYPSETTTPPPDLPSLPLRITEPLRKNRHEIFLSNRCNKKDGRGEVIARASKRGGNISRLVILRNGCVFYFSQTLEFSPSSPPFFRALPY